MERIKAIETNYNGHLFRSRLEARWAMLLDIIGVEYLYENEGYELEQLGRGMVDTGTTIQYLPDFYLPVAECFLEIKPNAPVADDDTEKIILLAIRSKKTVMVAFGPPWMDVRGLPEYRIHGMFYCEHDGVLNCYDDGILATDEADGILVSQIEPFDSERRLYKGYYLNKPPDISIQGCVSPENTKLSRAYKAVKRFRFEKT